MASFHILFGFRQEEMELKIVNMIKKKGHDVTYAERNTKESIKAYLAEHEDCTCAVLREGMGEEAYSAEDFAELTDLRDINIVAIVEASHKGTDYMQTLYGAGITSAILVSNKVGAFPANIAQLIMTKRTRKQARSVYGIIGNKIKLDIITYETYVHYYTKLVNIDEGLNLIDRYLSIVRELSVRQAADFTKKLPVELRRELTKYEEFHVVLDSMRRQGVTVNIKKPDNVKRGLTEEEFMRAIGRREAKAKKASSEVVVADVDEKAPDKSKRKNGKRADKSQETVEHPVTEPLESEENVFFNEYFDATATVEEGAVASEEEKNAEGEKMEVEKEDSLKNELPKEESSEPVVVKSNKKKKKVKGRKKEGGIRWKYVFITFFVGLAILGLWYLLLIYF